MNISKAKDNKIVFYLEIIVLIFLWAFMHVYKLGEVPTGLHIDEAGMAYDAFCLANWGVDRYLNPFPLYFYNMGGGQSAAYVYLCTFFIKVFGMDTYVFRIPALLFSFITIVFSSLIVNRCYGKNWALLNALLFCLLPYFTMQSRFGLDCNIMLGMATFCIYFTIYVLDKDKLWMYPVLGLCWGLGLYTYVLSYLIFPLFLIFLFSYMLAKRKITIKKILLILFPMVIVAIPLIVMVIINVFDLETIRTDFFTIYKLQDGRTSELSLNNFFKNIVYVFKVVFLQDGLPYDSLPKYYTMYLISIPICVIGFAYNIFSIVKCAIRKEFQQNTTVKMVMFLYFVAQTIVGGMISSAGISRMNAIFLPLLFYVVSGIYAIYSGLRLICKKYVPQIVVALLLLYYVFLFYGFQNYYFNIYPNSVYSMFLFTERIGDVICAFDKRIQDYKTYMDSYYLYYMIEKRVNPYLVNITQQEKYQYGTITFNSMYTDFPQDLSTYDIYVIGQWDFLTIDLLDEAGFNQHWTENYVIFYSDKVV